MKEMVRVRGLNLIGFIIILSGIFFSLFGCKKQVKLGTPYFPLKAGISYEYDYWAVDEEDDTLETGELILSFAQKETNDKSDRYLAKVCFITNGDTTTDTLYFEEKEFAILEYDSLGAVPDTFLSLPLMKGKSWRYEPFWHNLVSLKKDGGAGRKGGDFIAQNQGKEKVTIKAHEFKDAYKIEYSNEDISGDFYLARDVGLVRFSEREGDPESYSWFIWELKKY